MVQIRDVSKRAGVSPATVSRAFSDPSKLTEETLKRVLKAADDLDYKFPGEDFPGKADKQRTGDGARYCERPVRAGPVRY